MYERVDRGVPQALPTLHRLALLARKHPERTAGHEARPADPAGSKTRRKVRTGLRRQGLVSGGFPVPEQQLVDPGVRHFDDAAKHIGEPSLPVDVVEPANSHVHLPSAIQRIALSAVLFVRQPVAEKAGEALLPHQLPALCLK